ncbi:hypothetical protein GQ37_000730 [Janthinobacterium sp. BJB1]|uniref:YgiW/YdeI family stress tolerance OB fold protein n=1 Tax=Janthinobacterium sp. GW458P TaxID=1981504 RepID=UPI000A324709|nr:NirD/YgiW/YdeI family stress tolerance protein [Janthinobacterium sp. GW458P]MBE3025766.1 NirD/YgiW/YdeI family stress tolerance protein [Janthinobacterium sp. GW458P]PHV13618.1 hypothetical protein CSQ90_27730 [Janthinobacterium sp. BJB303]PJD00189.1 hypothetical protein GQ37_000730 [Janthinobacterium sp. BJB1]
MSLHRKLVVSLTAACAVLAGGAQAQFVGPSVGPDAPKTVAAVLKNPVDDQAVVLRGHLLRKVGNEKYTFSDGTAEIRVEIDNKVFMNRKIDARTLVEIRGEVEKDFMESPEIDVDVLTVVQ